MPSLVGVIRVARLLLVFLGALPSFPAVLSLSPWSAVGSCVGRFVVVRVSSSNRFCPSHGFPRLLLCSPGGGSAHLDGYLSLFALLRRDLQDSIRLDFLSVRGSVLLNRLPSCPRLADPSGLCVFWLLVYGCNLL